jgi:hypothetical protein
VLNVVVIQNATTNLVANSAGLASYLTLLKVEQGVRLTSAGIAFVLTKAWDLMAVWLFLLVTSILLWERIPGLHALIVVVLAVIGAGIALFFLATGLRQRFVVAVGGLLDRTGLARFGIAQRAMTFLRSLMEQEQGFSPRMIAAGILYSSIRQAVTMAWMFANMRAFAFDVGLVPIMFVNLLMQLVSYLPIYVLGGLGVSETTGLYFYSFLDVPLAELAAVLIGIRLVFYLSNLVMLLYLPLHAILLSRIKGRAGAQRARMAQHEKAG